MEICKGDTDGPALKHVKLAYFSNRCAACNTDDWFDSFHVGVSTMKAIKTDITGEQAT